MKRAALLVAALSCLAFASRASAQTTNPPVVYTAVDSVSLRGTSLYVTGVVQGDAAATTRTFVLAVTSSSQTVAYDDAVMQTCTRYGALAMAKPGAYLFTVQGYVYGVSAWPGCTLARAVP